MSLLLFVGLFIASPSLACLCASKQQAAPGRLQLQADPTQAEKPPVYGLVLKTAIRPLWSLEEGGEGLISALDP